MSLHRRIGESAGRKGEKGVKTEMKIFLSFVKKEIVLCVAVLLAVLSMGVVPPDAAYMSYLDFRTLGILFCLMTIVAGIREMGLFELLAGRLLGAVRGVGGMAAVLVLLCFFLSMLITNDVALITFVPFTLTVMERLEEPVREKWLLKTVVMQTIAANLGSMFTPIGNPQNLYLYGLADTDAVTFFWWMLPYTLLSLLLLLFWIFAAARRSGKRAAGRDPIMTEADEGKDAPANDAKGRKRSLPDGVAYALLALVSLLAVGHILPWWAALVMVLIYALCRNVGLLARVDYSLLGTFAALFVFVGNMGRIPAFRDMLMKLLEGHEIATAVLASQVMSNVPAAILLSGFTDRIRELIVGTNLGGLGTMIASMASLISFKYVAAAGQKKGRYFRLFTAANLVFLAVLGAAAYLLG